MQPRLDSLLWLRVFATFLVLIGHSASFFNGLPFTQWPNFPYIQSMAVTVFFCVSGYTIAWVFIERSSGFWKFAFDRATRLLIPLAPIILLFGAIEYSVYGINHPYRENFSVWTAFGNVLFLQNMSLGSLFDPHIEPFGLNRPLWTISIEFWTYIAFGALAFVCSRRSDNDKALLPIGLVALVLLLPYLVGGRGSGLPAFWFLGAALFFIQRDRPLPTSRLRVWLLPVWALALGVLAIPSLWPPGGEYSVLYNLLIYSNFVLFMVVVPGVADWKPLAAGANFFGGFAYTTYLAHYPIMYLISEAQMFPSGTPTALGVAAVCLFFSWLLSIPFERRYKAIRGLIWSRIVGQPVIDSR